MGLLVPAEDDDRKNNHLQGNDEAHIKLQSTIFTIPTLILNLQDLISSIIISARFWLDILHYTLLIAIIDGTKFIFYLLTPWRWGSSSLNSINVAMDTTPTFFSAFWRHIIAKTSSNSSKVEHSLSYTEGMELIKEFLQFASNHTVEELQSFTGKETPVPSWVNRTITEIPIESLDAAAEILTTHLKQDDGPDLKFVGGKNWWRLRCRPLYGEWLEMKRDAKLREERRKSGSNDGPEQADKVILYLHGGAHYFAGNGTHRYQIQRHARKLGARAFSVSFRLAPQYPFPCSLLDALAAYLYLIAPPTDDSSASPHTSAAPIHPHQIMLYGDSSGGGLALALLCLLRDSKLPLPAGCVLISPWVDLTHSFPSLMRHDTEGDYIPNEGFHFKPSLAWPPIRETPLVFEYPNPCQKIEAREDSKLGNNSSISSSNRQDDDDDEKKRKMLKDETLTKDKKKKGKLVIEEQIQLYCTNSLIGHPLVSLVNQGSLGGLPPLLILGGSSELLSDEITYIAHKAANPEKHPPAEATLKRYPNQRSKITEYPPTQVHLQIYDSVCHVATTLSFTKPAKFQYQSSANFSFWCLKNAQLKVQEEYEKEMKDFFRHEDTSFKFADYAKADLDKNVEPPPQYSSPSKFRLQKELRERSASETENRKQDDEADDQRKDGQVVTPISSDGHQIDQGDDDEMNKREEDSTSFPLQLPNGNADHKSSSGCSSPSSLNASSESDKGQSGLTNNNEPNSQPMKRDTSSGYRRRRSSVREQLEQMKGENGESITGVGDVASVENEDLSGQSESDSDSSSCEEKAKMPAGDMTGQPIPINGDSRPRSVTVTGQQAPFINNMIRERVSPEGYIQDMEPEADLAALQMDREAVGQISPDGPVWRWLEKRKKWDKKYRRDLIYYRKIRMKDRKKAEKAGFLSRQLWGENPPISSVAGMYDENLAWKAVRDQDIHIGADGEVAERAGLGMLLWSKLSSKPDAEQMGKKTLDELARKGDMKLKRRPSSIATPEIEKEIFSSGV